LDESILYNILYISRQISIVNMDTITYTTAHTKLAKTMDQVCEDHAPVIITRNKAQSVVMMSLEDYEALQETAHLLHSPKTTRRWLESIAELEEGAEGAQ
jgi:antitoxin YefM